MEADEPKPNFIKSQIKRLQSWWDRLRYGTGPQSVPRRIKGETMDAMMRDVQVLRDFGVNVRDLTPGEEPGTPTPAQPLPPAIEALAQAGQRPQAEQNTAHKAG